VALVNGKRVESASVQLLHRINSLLLTMSRVKRVSQLGSTSGQLH
jgi:hypothetical protein